MTLQPASGARDLNPKQVEINRLLTKRFSDVYKLWGYEEVAPPMVERIETLMAGGAINSREIVRLVADEPLGLRPEMTASIARAACTRLAGRKRPLRLCATGSVFESRRSAEGGVSIEENLQSGVELFGIKGIITELFKKIGNLDQSQRKDFASKLNSLKTKVTELLENLKDNSEKRHEKLKEIWENQELIIEDEGEAEEGEGQGHQGDLGDLRSHPWV